MMLNLKLFDPILSGDGFHHDVPPAFSRYREMSGLYGNPCVPEQSFSTSNRDEKAIHRALADMLGRIGTPVKGANMKGNSLGNQLRRKDILLSFRMFYSLLRVPGH